MERMKSHWHDCRVDREATHVLAGGSGLRWFDGRSGHPTVTGWTRCLVWAGVWARREVRAWIADMFTCLRHGDIHGPASGWKSSESRPGRSASQMGSGRAGAVHQWVHAWVGSSISSDDPIARRSACVRVVMEPQMAATPGPFPWSVWREGCGHVGHDSLIGRAQRD